MRFFDGAAVDAALAYPGLVDILQGKLNAIGEALFQAYIFQPFQTPDDNQLQQQEEQQQQAGPQARRQ